jgi:hypothetical protein
VLKWRDEWKPEVEAEGDSLLTMDPEPVNEGVVKLSITHVMNCAESKFIQAISGGWPRSLSNPKSPMETGEVVLKSHDMFGGKESSR